jgi:asparagine synthase (glutamine-hydrolysing)
MGGIAGWINFREYVSPPLRLDLLAHRGPDDQGEARYVSASQRVAASLGSTRLATLDLSSAGHMPMEHEAEPLALVYNGEIYNFLDLRRELAAAGERFRSRTDTEVILRGYRVWGDGVVARLRGMFAFGLWDGRGEGRLLLARDRFGKKPLYYRNDQGLGLAFSSELKTLLAGNIPRHLDPEGLEYFLDRGYPPPDRCLLQGFRKVSPGHFLVWEKGKLTEHQYWELPEPDSERSGMSLKRAGALLRESLIDATRRRLVAEVPVGLLLSDGVDSNSLLALMSRLSPEPRRTYTVCFGGAGLEESEAARQSALTFRTRHQALLINPRCGRLLPFVASHLDEPLADPSALATYLICRRARQEVTVLLTGEGSDELLFRTWLAENILVMIDKMSMAASVEIRAPFLDQEVTNFILTLPVRRRLGLRPGKPVLSEALRDLLPRHISWSRKRPSHLPLDDWLRCEWRLLVQDVLLDPRTRERGWVETREVRRLLEEHLAGRASHGRRLYQLLILELWARAILDRGEAEPCPASVADCVRELDPSRPIRQVAIIAPAGIGDTLRLTPGISQLGRTDPNISLTMYVAQGRDTEQILAGLSPVDRQVPIKFDYRGAAKVFQLLRDIRRNRPDLLVSTLISNFACLVGAFAGVRDRRSWVPQWSWSMRLGGLFWRHSQPYNPTQRDVGRQDSLAFCELLGVATPETLKLRMAPPLWEENCLTRARLKLNGLSRPILAVNAVARADIRQRQYPLEKLSQALAELLHYGIINSVALLGDRYSRSRHGPLEAALGPRVLDLSGELSLASTAAVMADCDAVLTIDGGLLHVALTTSLPVVVLYGPTEIFSTDPRGFPGRYVALSGFDRCGCECLNHRGIRVTAACREESQCLASLPPGEIVSAVTEVLEAAGTTEAGGGQQPC